MPRITSKDLHAEHEVSKEEMKKVFGGVEPTTFPSLYGPNLFSGGLSFSSRLKSRRLRILPDGGGLIGIVADDGSA